MGLSTRQRALADGVQPHRGRSAAATHHHSAEHGGAPRNSKTKGRDISASFLYDLRRGNACGLCGCRRGKQLLKSFSSKFIALAP